jgi:putative acetyltransferase
MQTAVRVELGDDQGSIWQVEAAAFGRAGEADLVDQLRENAAVSLSLVAEVDSKLVGHILFSPVTVETESGVYTALGLGPLAVLPDHQNQGIGSALCRNGLEHCRTLGQGLVFVVGHPGYYPRFGFRPAVPLGFDCAYVEAGQANHHFMVAELHAAALDGLAGYVRYRPEFDQV